MVKNIKEKIVKVVKVSDLKDGEIIKLGSTQIKDFVDFIRTQGVISLAVGLILGGAASVLVKSLVDNVVMPPLGLLLGSAEGLKGLELALGKTASGVPAVLQYGIFLNDFVNFIVIALVVYVTVRLLKVDKLDKKK